MRTAKRVQLLLVPMFVLSSLHNMRGLYYYCGITMFAGANASSADSAPLAQAHLKNREFRSRIRRQEVDQLRQSLRQQLLNSLCQDYHVLKNIDLVGTLREFEELSGESEKEQWDSVVSRMFLYANSDQKDHFYSIVTASQWERVISLTQPNTAHHFEQMPRTYIRLVFIMANYASYSLEPDEVTPVSHHCCGLMSEILAGTEDYLSSKHSWKVFSHEQTTTLLNILINCCLTPLADKPHFLADYCSGHPQCPMSLLLKHGKQVIRHAQQHGRPHPNSLIYLNAFFSSVLALPPRPQHPLNAHFLSAFQSIIDLLLQQLATLQLEPHDKGSIAHSIYKFMLENLQGQPKILLTHDFSIVFRLFHNCARNMAENEAQTLNYHQRIELQGHNRNPILKLESSLAKIRMEVMRWMELIRVIYGINLPAESEAACLPVLEKWLHSGLKQGMEQLLQCKQLPSDILEAVFRILHDICLEQRLYESITEENLFMSQIFFHAKSQSAPVKVKISAVSCVCSLTRLLPSLSRGQQELLEEMLMANGLTSILARHVGEYADADINEDLLEALYCHLSREVSEELMSGGRWVEFCREGGRKRLERLIKNSRDPSLIGVAQGILDQYDIDD